ELYASPAGGAGSQSHTDARVRLLQTIGETGDVAAVPNLIPCLLDEDPRVKATAAALIADLLDSADPRFLLALDSRRAFPPYLTGAVRLYSYVLKPADLLRRPGIYERAAIVGLLSFHESGYIREAAVRELSGRPDPNVLPYLLIRVNDWV